MAKLGGGPGPSVAYVVLAGGPKHGETLMLTPEEADFPELKLPVKIEQENGWQSHRTARYRNDGDVPLGSSPEHHGFRQFTFVTFE